MIEPKESAEKHANIDEGIKLLLERVPLGITLSQGDSLLYVNRAYLRLIRYGDSPVQRNASMLVELTPQWRKIVQANGHSSPATSLHQSTGQRDDGSTFQFQIEFGCINFHNGNVTVAFITDIAEPDKMKAEIQELASSRFNSESVFNVLAKDQPVLRDDRSPELRRSSDPSEISQPATNGSPEKEGLASVKLESGSGRVPDAIGPWLQAIAHDFNNLLTLIQVNASTLLAEKKLDKDLTDSAEQIYRAVDQAANLTSKLLTFGRGEQG